MDEDGFNIPTSSIAWPSTDSSSNQTFSHDTDGSDSDDSTQDGTSPKFKISISKSVIQENPNDALKTMQNVAAVLQAAPTLKKKRFLSFYYIIQHVCLFLFIFFFFVSLKLISEK